MVPCTISRIFWQFRQIRRRFLNAIASKLWSEPSSPRSLNPRNKRPYSDLPAFGSTCVRISSAHHDSSKYSCDFQKVDGNFALPHFLNAGLASNRSSMEDAGNISRICICNSPGRHDNGSASAGLVFGVIMNENGVSEMDNASVVRCFTSNELFGPITVH